MATSTCRTQQTLMTEECACKCFPACFPTVLGTLDLRKVNLPSSFPACSLHEEEQQGTCPLNIELKWLTEVSSSVYATPLITDLYSDGRKDIIVPSFVHNVEVRDCVAKDSFMPPA
eukprot:237548-Pelagomonas_calceolata.AAC.2